MRVRGKGQPGGSGRGDLIILTHVTPHAYFKREGNDIFFDQPISFAQAALGDEIEVKTVHGDVKLKIPAGTQTETNFRLRGKGVPRVNGNGNGDEHVKVRVETPKNLNKAQKEALYAFAEASGKAVGKKKGVFDKLKDALDD